ncbi:hypothetical protein GLOIN_2v1790501 [Rhizophagus irregularis DAOM 181602=DAOM 197198]|nr:hypothetical protein GLOIN_2v1790501 [Rhizophagus irregularis DAOM 181602=DAOM 197198]
MNKLLDPNNHITLEHVKNINDIWKLVVSEDHISDITFIDLIKVRCNKLNEIDRSLGIDKNVKKQHFGSTVDWRY